MSKLLGVTNMVLKYAVTGRGPYGYKEWAQDAGWTSVLFFMVAGILWSAPLPTLC
jgi:hypothetical protein